MEPRISLNTLGVSDLPKSIAFYRGGLALPLRDGPDGTAFFELKGLMLALYPRRSLAEDAEVSPLGSGSRGFTLSHIVDSPEAVDRTLKEALDAGTKLVGPGQKVFWGGYSGYFSDRDDFLWEVAWNPHFSLDSSGIDRSPCLPE